MTRLSRYRPDEKKHKKRALILAIMMIVLSVFDFFTSSSVSAASSHTTRINLSADQVKQNGNITLTADAIENGSTATSGYTYRFLYNTDGSTSAYPLGDYSGQNWYSFKPSDISRLKDYTGAVFIFADSKKNGSSVWSKYKILNIIPNDEEGLKATGSVTSAGSYTVGDKLIVTMTASGGKAPYTYKYEYGKAGGTYSTYKDYTSTSSVTIPTDSWSANTDYYIKVTVRDSNSKTFSQKATIKISKAPTLSPTVSTDPSSATVVKGKDITFTVDTHSDGTENYPPQPYKFKFEYKKSGAGSYSSLRAYGDSEKYKYNTKNLDAGDYVLKATVKDKNGKEYTKTVNFTVDVPKITFSVDPGSKDFFTGGGSDKAVIEVKNVKGGTSDEYEYKFEYVRYGSLTDTTLTPPTNSSSWQKIKDFGGESSADFKVDKDDDAGIYAVRVSVQNKDNTNNSLIYRQIIQDYTVKVKVQHTLADLNTLIDKVDTWVANSIQVDMWDKIKDWTNNEHWNELPAFSYTSYQSAYDAAKAANTNGDKNYDTLYANLEYSFTTLQKVVNSGYVSPDLGEGDSPLGIANGVFMLYKGLLNIITDTFKSMADSSVTSTVFYGFDYNAIADKIFPLFRTFAYALIIIFAGVNALETALQYEMFTLRGGVKILARLTFAKIWVDISLIVCRGIVAIATDWLGQITQLTADIANSLNVGVSLQHSDAWIIGWLIDFFNGLLLAAGILLLLIPLVVLILIMFVKLFIRYFELAMLQCVSPVFFACLTGEATKQYFKKFILTYISVVVEVVFMALIWYIYVEYLNQAFSVSTQANTVLELFSLEGGIMNFFMVSVGAFILMIKPPQVLKNLVSA